MKNPLKETRGPPIIMDDVLIDILSRLPVKSIFRFKCVCKAWQFLISDHSRRGILLTTMSGLFYSIRILSGDEVGIQCTFIADRSQPNMNNAAIDNVGDLNFFPHQDKDKFCIVNCCNGLLVGFARQGISNTSVYYVINPATKKWAVLPRPPKRCDNHLNHMLAFDPLVSPHYTLICSGPFNGVDIFSSKTRLWVQSKVPEALIIKFPTGPPAQPNVLLNRTLHMLSDRNSIVGFDLDGERFRLIPLPGPKSRDWEKYLGVSEGYLYYVIYDYCQLQIWILKDYDEHGWDLKYEITINSLVEKYPEAICSSPSYMSFCNYCRRHELAVTPEGSHLPFWLHMKYLSDDQILANRLSRHYYQHYFRFVGFHPDFEVVFIKLNDTLLYYHLNSMKLEKLSSLNPMYRRLHHMSFYFPFSPCLADFYDS